MGVMIKGPSDAEPVGAGAGGASLGGAGAPLGGWGAPLGSAGALVGDGSTLVTTYEVFELGETAGDDAAADEGAVVGWVLGLTTGTDISVLEGSADVALADEDGTMEGATACEEDSTGDETAGGSAGADDGEGGTVVYCVTMTTGGTGSDVEGRSSADGDSRIDDWIEEDSGTAGIAAAAELDAAAELTGVVGFRDETSTELVVGNASEAAGVGNTVVYSVFVTTSRDEVATVVFLDGSMAELTGIATLEA